jgi:methionyl-tRNA formyltransferase
MRIVVLTSETPANIWLVNSLMSRHDVVGMVIERRPLALTREQKFERRRQLLRRHGLVRTLNKLLYNSLRSRLLAKAEGEAVRQDFFPGGTSPAYQRSVPTLAVENINDPAGARFIQSLTPAVLVVCGTTVLKPEIFSLAPKGAVNIHTGITPEYRSADPIFWALYCGEPGKVGVTIHYVDRGIDTGPIIHQQSVPVYANDSLASIYVRCIRLGAELFSRALGRIEDGSIRTIQRTGVQGRSFRSIDLGLVQYLLFYVRFRRMARKLPRVDRGAAAGGAGMAS